MATSFTFTEHDVQEEFFARGWTDGLPVVPPTPDRVEEMLTFAGVTAGDVLVPFRNVLATSLRKRLQLMR